MRYNDKDCVEEWLRLWWCLTPLATMFHLYLAVSFFGGGNRRNRCSHSIYRYLLNNNIYKKQFIHQHGPSWLWWYGNWIYNYLCNQCPSPLIPLYIMAGVKVNMLIITKVLIWNNRNKRCRYAQRVAYFLCQ
jgi:hypothetical protein